MPIGPFNISQPLTMGVELELQLLNLSDFDLAAASGDLLELLQTKSLSPSLSQSNKLNEGKELIFIGSLLGKFCVAEIMLS